jgi:hypothetical protein
VIGDMPVRELLGGLALTGLVVVGLVVVGLAVVALLQGPRY